MAPRTIQRVIGLIQNSMSGERLVAPFPVVPLPVGHRTYRFAVTEKCFSSANMNRGATVRSPTPETVVSGGPSVFGEVTEKGRNHPSSKRRLRGVKRNKLPFDVSGAPAVPWAHDPDMTPSR